MPVIEFEHVSKKYRLGVSGTSLREAIPQLTRRLISKNASSTDKEFWALNDVSFQIEQGEVVGIIGHNGAGKSTTLKLLSKVTYPTSGHINTKGRMAALIELGAGFHPELTGIENIYLNGSILGLRRHEIKAQLDEIIDFAELEQFIHTPVKRYSSGMYVRLAFSVAAHLKADLLLVDEVLSVGDVGFQQKSLAKMRALRDTGSTIVFVSHNLMAIQSFCSRAILLQHGQVVSDGTPQEIVKEYRKLEADSQVIDLSSNTQSAAAQIIDDPETLTITNVQLSNQHGVTTDNFQSDDTLSIDVSFASPEDTQALTAVIDIFRMADGLKCCELTRTIDESWTLGRRGMIEARIAPLQLGQNTYFMHVQLLDERNPKLHALSPKVFFTVTEDTSPTSGLFRPLVEWETRTPTSDHDRLPHMG